MYAIVKAGGRQLKVAYGDEVRIDRVQAEPGSHYLLEKVLMVGGGEKIQVGRPYLADVTIDTEIVEHGKAAKVTAFKKHRRKNYRRKRGFRAQYTIVRIGAISGIEGEWHDIPHEAVPTEDVEVVEPTTVEAEPAEGDLEE